MTSFYRLVFRILPLWDLLDIARVCGMSIDYTNENKTKICDELERYKTKPALNEVN